MEFLIIVDIFSVFLLYWYFFCQDRFKRLSLTNWFFFAHTVIYFGNKLANQIQNSKNLKEFQIQLNDFRNSDKKKCVHIPLRGAHGVMVIVVGNGHGDTSSNLGQDWLHFTLH